MLFVKRLLFQSIVIILLGFLNQNSLLGQWELVLDKDSVQVYNKPNSDGYSYYKAIAYINAPAYKVAEFLTNIEDFPRWVNNCSATTLVYSDDNKIIYRAEYDMPWPISNRYSISQLIITNKTTGNYEFKTSPIAIDSLVIGDAILISRFREQVKLKQIGQNLTVIELSGAYDPAGAIPSWLTDKFMKFGPYDMVLKMRESIE